MKIPNVRNSILGSILLTAVTSLLTMQVFAEGHSLVGEKIADFSAKITSVNYLDDRNVLNLESDGTIGDLGTVGASATFMHPVAMNPSTGIYYSHGASFRPDDTVVGFTGHGVWKALGSHSWQVKTIGLANDGSRTFAVGVLDLDTRSFKGSVYKLD